MACNRFFDLVKTTVKNIDNLYRGEAMRQSMSTVSQCSLIALRRTLAPELDSFGPGKVGACCRRIWRHAAPLEWAGLGLGLGLGLPAGAPASHGNETL